MNMKKIFGGIAIAAGLALLPMTASAVSVTQNAGNVVDGGTYDIAAGPFFANFDFFEGGTSTGGTLTFTFENNSATDVVGAVSVATILQSIGSFDGDLVLTFGADSSTVASGVTTSLSLATSIAASGSAVLTIAYTDVTGGSSTAPATDVDFTVAAIPLPAGILLLLSGIGGLALVGRRRTMAA